MHRAACLYSKNADMYKCITSRKTVTAPAILHFLALWNLALKVPYLRAIYEYGWCFISDTLMLSGGTTEVNTFALEQWCSTGVLQDNFRDNAESCLTISSPPNLVPAPAPAPASFRQTAVWLLLWGFMLLRSPGPLLSSQFLFWPPMCSEQCALLRADTFQPSFSLALPDLLTSVGEVIRAGGQPHANSKLLFGAPQSHASQSGMGADKCFFERTFFI